MHRQPRHTRDRTHEVGITVEVKPKLGQVQVYSTVVSLLLSFSHTSVHCHTSKHPHLLTCQRCYSFDLTYTVFRKIVFLPFGLIDLTFNSIMDGNGKRSLFPLNLLCTPPLLIGTTLLSIYLYMLSGTGFVERKLAKINKNSWL